MNQKLGKIIVYMCHPVCYLQTQVSVNGQLNVPKKDLLFGLYFILRENGLHVHVVVQYTIQLGHFLYSSYSTKLCPKGHLYTQVSCSST